MCLSDQDPFVAQAAQLLGELPCVDLSEESAAALPRS